MITDMSRNMMHAKNDTLILPVEPPSTNTAMSLWHKFSTWQSEMDRCRTMERTIRDEQDEIRTQMKYLLHRREKEQRKIQQMEQPPVISDTLSKSSVLPVVGSSTLERLRELQRTLDDVEEQYRTASASLQVTKQKDFTQTKLRDEILRETIDNSGTFTFNCRRIQYLLRTSALDSTPDVEAVLPGGVGDNIEISSDVLTLHAVLCAAKAEHTGIVGVDDMWISKTIQDLQDSSVLHSTTLLDFVESEDENNPNVWKVCKEKDIVLYRAVELHNQQLETHAIVEKELEQLQSKYNTLRSKGLDRDRRLMKLQTQLQRIQNDCMTIESEIDQYQELILEDEALAHTYRTKIDQRNQSQSKHNTARRRIGLHHGDHISFEKLPTQQRPSTLASLIPPIQTAALSMTSTKQVCSHEGHVVHNPYTAARKRPIETDPSNHRRHDLASIVLGHPSQQQHGTVNSVLTSENEFVPQKNHRRRTFRDRFEFGCSLEIDTTCDVHGNDYNATQATNGTLRGRNTKVNDCSDGDTAGGSAMDMLVVTSNKGQLSATSLTLDQVDLNTDDATVHIDAPDEDDDLLAFVAFPQSQGRSS